MRDLKTGRVTLLSRAAKKANEASLFPAISANGKFATMQSKATNLTNGVDANGDKEDIFRRGPLR
jgi:hypothetical protein